MDILIVGFNSSMVRLGVKLAELCGRAYALFQFQYGAIRSRISIYFAYCPFWFQFQYGAIRRRKNITFLRNFYRSFNSSMVRLGEKLSPNFTQPKTCFNSSMVRLGELKMSYPMIKRR